MLPMMPGSVANKSPRNNPFTMVRTVDAPGSQGLDQAQRELSSGWSGAAGAELEGTEAPVKVEETHTIDVVVGRAAMQVIAGLTAEQLAVRLARVRERKALAERGVVVVQGSAS